MFGITVSVDKARQRLLIKDREKQIQDMERIADGHDQADLIHSLAWIMRLNSIHDFAGLSDQEYDELAQLEHDSETFTSAYRKLLADNL